MAAKPEEPEKRMRASGQKESTEKSMTKDVYELIARFQLLFRTMEGHFHIMTAMDDTIGIHLIGLAATDPLQLLQMEYENFSGLKSLSIPRRMKDTSTTTPFLDTSQKLVNANASKLLEIRSLAQLNVSDDAVRLLTGRFPMETLVSRQKELFRTEMTLKGKGERTGKQKYLTWFGLVANEMYREYRIYADLVAAPGCMTALDTESEQITAARALLMKRMFEVPHLAKHWQHVFRSMNRAQAFQIVAMCVSPYGLITRFEQDNFLSHYEWAKPRPFSDFAAVEGDLYLIVCKVSDLSPLHNVQDLDETGQQSMTKKAELVRKWLDELETSVEACIQILNLTMHFYSPRKNSTRIIMIERAIDGIYYTFHVLKYREQLMSETGNVPEHLLTLIYHLLDVDIQLTEHETSFVEMWSSVLLQETMPTIAYLTNFLETARRESLSPSNSKKTCEVYKNICACLPKIGKFIRENTKSLYEDIAIENIIKQFTPL